jgi:ParB family transcriptional regulator, chromosome partitioning protein
MTEQDAKSPAAPRSARRRGLGRGLGALIPRSSGGLLELELQRIRPNPEQPRLAIDDTALEALAESIRQHGLLQPVVVSQAALHDDVYLLIAGERRWRAAQRAGLRTIPALVKEAAPRARLELALVENVQREDLTPLELAAAYRALIEDHDLTQEQVAQRVGKSRVTVTNTIRLLGLPAAARTALADGRISEGHGRALLGAPSEAALQTALTAVLAERLTVHQTEELVRRKAGGEAGHGKRKGRSAPAAMPPSADTAYLEERLRQRLGTKVQLLRGRRGGRLVVHFFSDEELQGIYQLLCGEELD